MQAQAIHKTGDDVVGVLRADSPGDPSCSDYTLDCNATSVWITIGNLSVYVMRTDEGVAVDLIPKGKEWCPAIASTWALDSEGIVEDDEEPAHPWCTRPSIPS